VTPTDLEPNPPNWLINVVANENAEQNREYQDAAYQYRAAIARWITANVQNRAAGHVIYPSTSGLGATKQYDMPVDPTLPQPVLPPPAAAGNPAPFEPITGTGSNSSGSDPNLLAVLALVQKIAKAVGVVS
jgi:hypothetical protein